MIAIPRLVVVSLKDLHVVSGLAVVHGIVSDLCTVACSHNTLVCVNEQQCTTFLMCMCKKDVFLPRVNGGLQSLLQLCSSADKELRLPVVRALEQIMVSANRHYIARHKFVDSLVKVACSSDNGLEAIQRGTGILENLFKESAETCLRLIHSGALEGIIYACRYTDPTTLQHCAAALANCAMYGEHKSQSAMVSKKADHWLFPLAFSTDNVVKYYALLAVCFLAANVHLAERVTQSGTLELVLPFLNTQDIEEFVSSCPNHAHGRSAEWLQHLVPLLVSYSEEARSLAAFHFAMEAEIKKKQQRLHVSG